MDYFDKKTIYYSTFIGELLGVPAEDVFNKIAPIFFKDGDEKIRSVLADEYFKGLRTSLSVYLSYVDSFCTKSMCGQDDMGKEAIEIKIDIIRTIEKYRAEHGKDMLEHVADNLDDGNRFGVLSGLALFFKGDSSEKILPIIRRFKRSSSGIDACLVLMALEPDEREKHFSDLLKCKTVGLYPEVIKTAGNGYGLLKSPAIKQEGIDA